MAIAPVANPTHFRLAVGDVGTALALGLAVGPGATAGELAGSRQASGARTAFDAALASQHLVLGDEIVSAAAKVLTQDGYEVRSTPNAALADATLSFDIQDVAYERRVWGQVGPRAIVQATLIDSTGRKLFSRLYWYDMHAIGLGKTVLTPEDRFGFDTEQDGLAHPDLAAEGLRAVIPLIMTDLAVALRKPTP